MLPLFCCFALFVSMQETVTATEFGERLLQPAEVIILIMLCDPLKCFSVRPGCWRATVEPIVNRPDTCLLSWDCLTNTHLNKKPLTGKQHHHAENILMSMYIYISKYIYIYHSIQSHDNTCGSTYLIIRESRNSSSTYINIIIVMVEKMISRLSRMKLKTLKWCSQDGMKNQKKELKKLSLQNVELRICR